jgi:mRNA-degrading endonuclease HigB of HigAB toxin-antitoxin module
VATTQLEVSVQYTWLKEYLKPARLVQAMLQSVCTVLVDWLVLDLNELRLVVYVLYVKI